jgi:hypothetical protein
LTLFLEILLLQAAAKAAHQIQQLVPQETTVRLVALAVAVAQDLLEIQMLVGQGLLVKVILAADAMDNSLQIDIALAAVAGQVQ